MAAPAAESIAALALEWQLWLVENLLSGASPAELVEALAGQGVAREHAAVHVHATLSAEPFARLRAARQRATRAERAFQLLRQDVLDVPRVAALSREAFYLQHFMLMRPVLLTEQLHTLRAFSAWDFDALAARFGAVEVPVTSERERAPRPVLVESHSAAMPFSALCAHAQHGRGNDRYLVARNGLLHLPAFAPLLGELAPLPDFLQPVAPPRPPISLWLGPAGTHTPLHFDPHAALLLQLRGRKKVRMLPPTETFLYELAEGYFSSLDLDDVRLRGHREFRPERVLEVELLPGQALFVPALFWHDVRALDSSMTVSFLNFVWPNDYHGILDMPRVL